MIDLTELYNSITDRAVLTQVTYPPTIQVAERHYLRQPNPNTDSPEEYLYQEVVPDERFDPRVLGLAPRLQHVSHILNIQSLLRWTMGCPDSDGQILLSRRDDTEATSPRLAPKNGVRNTARKMFFRDYLPPAGVMGYVSFLSWIDRLGDRLQHYEEIHQAMAQASVMVDSGATLRQTGAVIQFQAESKQQVSAPIPRRLSARIPFGDPGFETDVSWLLSASADKKGSDIRVVAELLGQAAQEAYAAWALARLDDALPQGWVVLVTP
ncbi:MAG: hypothetical protein ABIL09_10950 [Gemmatimonadota bacterium]